MNKTQLIEFLKEVKREIKSSTETTLVQEIETVEMINSYIDDLSQADDSIEFSAEYTVAQILIKLRRL